VSIRCLVGDHLLLRDFRPYGIFTNVRGMTVALEMLFGDFGPFGIIFMNVCCYHGNVVEVIWALWDNICDYMCLLL
jgi:hypothetical protein